MRLSIFIPTYNRPHYFNRLMASLAPQSRDDVEIVVSSNGSTQGYEIPDGVRLIQQFTNTGGRVPWMLGPVVTTGDYLWMMGDDERILTGAVQHILDCLEDQPGILLNHDGIYDLGVPLGSRFACYRDFVQAQQRIGRSPAVTAHTLCAVNVFRREAFDLPMAVKMCDTMYGQHYAMLSRLMNYPIHVVSQPTFRAGSSAEASIWSHPAHMQAEHSNAYPTVIYQLIEWINEWTGAGLNPVQCWVPGDGFDSPWRSSG